MQCGALVSGVLWGVGGWGVGWSVGDRSLWSPSCVAQLSILKASFLYRIFASDVCPVLHFINIFILFRACQTLVIEFALSVLIGSPALLVVE